MCLSMFTNRTEKQKYILLTTLSFLVLATSLIFEHGFDLPVCQLCMYERYPYTAAIGFGLFGVFFHKNPASIRFARTLLLFVFALSFLLSVYHVLIEHGLIPLPDFCKTGLSKVSNFNELKTQIMAQKKLVPCNTVPLRILFLSLAEWNGIVSLLLFAGAWHLKKK